MTVLKGEYHVEWDNYSHQRPDIVSLQLQAPFRSSSQPIEAATVNLTTSKGYSPGVCELSANKR